MPSACCDQFPIQSSGPSEWVWVVAQHAATYCALVVAFVVFFSNKVRTQTLIDMRSLARNTILKCVGCIGSQRFKCRALLHIKHLKNNSERQRLHNLASRSMHVVERTRLCGQEHDPRGAAEGAAEAAAVGRGLGGQRLIIIKKEVQGSWDDAAPAGSAV